MKRFSISRLGRAASLLSLATASGLSSAGINVLDKPELLLVVLDQTTAKMSYMLDLGIEADSFWVQAQQDAGASLFRTLDPATDTAFSTFIAAANPATTRWLVMSVGSAAAEIYQSFYTTMTNNGVVATQTLNFDKFKNLNSNGLVAGTEPYRQLLTTVSITPEGAGLLKTTHTSTANGSSVASKDAGNSTTYADGSKSFESSSGTGDGDCLFDGAVCAGNPVGTSSWFYKLLPTSVDGTPAGGVDDVPLVLDEFDNLTADGYWGFAKDPATGKYILSYTLAGSNPKSLVSTDAGRSRLSFTDYSAQSGSARQIVLAADDIANSVDANAFVNGTNLAVSAVPEPQSWGLMALGLVGLGAVARRRRDVDAGTAGVRK